LGWKQLFPAGSEMIRIREILDPELRNKVLLALAERRGCSAAAIPEWFELDDADYVDILNDIRAAERGLSEDDDEPLRDPRE
jgi:hypothetical protein